jgi:acetolactate decarboxylase
VQGCTPQWLRSAIRMTTRSLGAMNGCVVWAHDKTRLAEVTSHQVETVARDIRGTVVGFWTPAIYQGIAVAGLHLHFLSEDRSIGGHVLDLAAHSGDLHVAAFARFDLHLPTDDLFLRTELTHAEDHRIVAVEGGVAVSAEEPS